MVSEILLPEVPVGQIILRRSGDMLIGTKGRRVGGYRYRQYETHTGKGAAWRIRNSKGLLEK